MSEKSPEILKNAPNPGTIHVSAEEFRSMLNYSGLKYVDFCSKAGVSANQLYYALRFGGKGGVFPLLYVSKLREIIGDENFLTALEIIREKKAVREQKNAEAAAKRHNTEQKNNNKHPLYQFSQRYGHRIYNP